MSNPTVKFFSLPFAKFPSSGEAGSLYYASDTKSLFLCCGPSAYFEMTGLLQPNISLMQEVDATRIGNIPVDLDNIPEEGQALVFDGTKWVATTISSGVTPEQVRQTSIAMAIALG